MDTISSFWRPPTLSGIRVPRKILRDYISGELFVPKNSSYGLPNPVNYVEIGKGTFGVVLAPPLTTVVIKKPIRDDERSNEMLYNEFVCHKIVFEAFDALNYTAVHIPRPLLYDTIHDTSLRRRTRTMIPEAYRQETDLLFAERIIPVPRSVRESLIELYCHEDKEIKIAAKASLQNEDCLIQPLLGRRKGNISPPRTIPSLRNFPLCVDQMEDLDIDVRVIIESMAQSLAILHWKAKVDAYDIKFAFGLHPTDLHHTTLPRGTQSHRPRIRPNSAASVFWRNQQMGFPGKTVHLWILDFDKAARIHSDQDFVNMAVRGFVDQSQPFYPRPYGESRIEKDLQNWNIFCECYLSTCRALRGGDTAETLPRQFLEHVENYYFRTQMERQERENLGAYDMMDMLSAVEETATEEMEF